MPEGMMPPHNRDAERGVLGALLRDNSLWPHVAEILLPADFYTYAHRLVFDAIGVLYGKGETADAVKVSHYFGGRKDRQTGRKLIDEVGGLVYLAELWESAPVIAEPLEYARIVREQAALRDVIRSCGLLEQQGKDQTASLDSLQRIVDGLGERLNAARSGTTVRRKVGTMLCDVTEEAVDWLWYHRIPLGMITIVDGDPGKGKSMMTMDLAARVTMGALMPDGTEGPTGGVVILNAEDDMSKTILPRALAAGADPRKIKVVGMVPTGNGKEERLFRLPLDIPLLTDAVREVQAKLVVIDPVLSYLGELKGNSDQDVRAALLPLKEMAQREQVAVVLVRHLNKTVGSSALYRGSGSIGFVGVARQVLLVAEDPDHRDNRIVAVCKSNLGPFASSLAFTIANDYEGRARCVWIGSSEHTADALVASPKDDGEDKSGVDEAKEVLRHLLEKGRQRADETKKEAARAGVSAITLKRAKSILGVRSVREGFQKDAVWYWELPPVPEAKA